VGNEGVDGERGMKRPPNRADLSAEFVRSLFSYDPETGTLVWKVQRRRIKIGTRAGFVRRDGYREITISDIGYLEHRLAWLIVHGEWPASEIDHIDRNKANNAITNLRLVTRGLNRRNTVHRGYYLRPDNGKHMAYIAGHDGKRIQLGHFDSPEDAHEAYRRASIEMFGEFSAFAEREWGAA
jgi:hypothetical protein